MGHLFKNWLRCVGSEVTSCGEKERNVGLHCASPAQRMAPVTEGGGICNEDGVMTLQSGNPSLIVTETQISCPA